MKTRRESLIKRLWRAVFPQVPDFQARVAEQCRLLEQALQALAAFLEQARGEHAQEVRHCVQRAHALRQRNLDSVKYA